MKNEQISVEFNDIIQSLLNEVNILMKDKAFLNAENIALRKRVEELESLTVQDDE